MKKRKFWVVALAALGAGAAAAMALPGLPVLAVVGLTAVAGAAGAIGGHERNAPQRALAGALSAGSAALCHARPDLMPACVAVSGALGAFQPSPAK